MSELGLAPVERASREGVSSWDLLLDGRQRRRVRVTLILDPGLGLVAWVHYAPPLSDNLRKTYRQLLRWNDELPFAKFALSEDERPVLTAEVAADALNRDTLGLTLARLLAICDLVYSASRKWVDRIAPPKGAPPAAADESGRALLERYAAELGELGELGEFGQLRELGELGGSR